MVVILNVYSALASVICRLYNFLIAFLQLTDINMLVSKILFIMAIDVTYGKISSSSLQKIYQKVESRLEEKVGPTSSCPGTRQKLNDL